MTVNSNAMMASYASQINSNTNSNSKVQSQSGASGTWTGNTQSTSPDFSAIAQQFMALLDTNKSGSIDKTEFSQAAQALSKNSANSTQVDNAFSKIDGNSDSQISSDEMLTALKDAMTAQAQTQKGHHQHQASANPADLTSQLTQSTTSTQQSSPANEMQKVLFNKIMAAYGSSTATTGSTTNISA
ncbi:MAG: EF-hand domain-containing protein [Sulfurimonas sp.]|jgi:Ca2+-binding EF-hand superfamily protein